MKVKIVNTKEKPVLYAVKGEVYHPNLVAAWSAKGKSNDDADRAVIKAY